MLRCWELKGPQSSRPGTPPSRQSIGALSWGGGVLYQGEKRKKPVSLFSARIVSFNLNNNPLE